MTAVSDSFGGTLSGWTAANGSFSIVSGKMRGTTVGNSPASYNRFNTSTGSVDCFCQAVISSTQVASFSNTGMACRMRAAANTSYQVTGRHAADTLMVWKITAGTEAQLTWQTGAQSLSTVWGSGDTLREEVVGSLIRAKVNGALVGFCVDTSITDGMLVGVNTYNDQAGDFGEYDDWAGGALAADGGLAAPYLVGISAQFTGTGTSLGLTVPSNVATGDTVLVHSVSRDAAQTPTAPGSQGWSASIQTPSQTGLRSTLHAKVWGLGGQTDSTSPSFTIGSGTAGWGAVVTVWRNPSHSTNPWTTAAAAIVASGSSTDATTTSATRSCPSVNHDGTHRTLARFLDSGDDNALGTNSEGGLAYGGANYDSITGNDFAQALSVREDVTVTTSTGTATFAETLVGNDISNGITVVLGIPPTATDLVVGDAAQAQATDGVALTQVHQLAVADATQGQSTDGVALTQVHNLTVADATQGQSTDGVSPTQAHLLVVADAAQAQPVDSPPLTQAHVLVVGDATQSHTADAPALTQTHGLTVSDAAQAQSADNVVLTTGAIDIAVQDATQAQTATSPSLSQAHGLSVADATQSQSSSSPALTQAHSVSVGDAGQGQAAESPSLTQDHSLVAADAAQAQPADSPTLTQVHELEVAGATQAQSADAVTVSEVGPSDLQVADAAQSHTVDNVTLTQGHVLAAADASQAQTVDSPTLTQTHVLVVADARQAQLADAVALTQVHQLAVADASEAQSVDGPGLSQVHVLAVGDATQAQAAENVTLVLGATNLAVQGARHSQTVDTLTLAQAHVLVVADALHAQSADTVVLSLPGVLRFASRAGSQVTAADLASPLVTAQSRVARRVQIDSITEEVAHVE